MPKQVEPLPCLCGKVPICQRTEGKSRCLYCGNLRCIGRPRTNFYSSYGYAVRAWNRWIREGIRRLAKVVEEQP